MRATALVTAAVAAAVTGGLAVHYAGDTTAGALDRALTTWLRDVVGSGLPLELLADLGNAPVVALAAVALAVLALRSGRPRLAALAVAAPTLTALATVLLKVATDRTYGDHLAYPSGHAGLVTAVVLVAALLVPPRWRLLAPLVVAAVAAALVVRGYHYPTDTVGGVALAVTVVAGARAAWPGRAPQHRAAVARAALDPR